MKNLPVVFEEHEIRRLYDEKTDTWFFSVVDIIQVLIQQPDYQAARNYWKVLKSRLRKEGSESVTNCNRLKLPAADGKNYLTDVASAETLLRLVQSVPSPKAEPIKLWLAKVGYERMQELADPARAVDRARETWQKHGRRQDRRQHRPKGPPGIGTEDRPKCHHRAKLPAARQEQETQKAAAMTPRRLLGRVGFIVRVWMPLGCSGRPARVLPYLVSKGNR